MADPYTPLNTNWIFDYKNAEDSSIFIISTMKFITVFLFALVCFVAAESRDKRDLLAPYVTPYSPYVSAPYVASPYYAAPYYASSAYYAPYAASYAYPYTAAYL